MKKIILFLGLMMLAFATSAPSAFATDNDIGTVVLPADNNAVVTVVSPAVDLTFESVTVIATRDPGSLNAEPFAMYQAGLRGDSPAVSSSLPQGDVIDNKSVPHDLQCTKALLVKHDQPGSQILSTSCGGIGY